MVLQAVGRFHLHVLPVLPVLLMVLIVDDRCVDAVDVKAFVTDDVLAIRPVSHTTLMTDSLASAEQKTKQKRTKR